MHSPHKQRQRIFPVQSRGFSLSNLTSNNSAKNKFQKSINKYVGPLVICKIIDPHNYLLITIDGQLLRALFEHIRLKPSLIKTGKVNVTTKPTLKKIINSEIISPASK